MYNITIFKDLTQSFPEPDNHEVRLFKSKENALIALEEEFEKAKEHFKDSEKDYLRIEKYDSYFEIKDDCNTIYVSLSEVECEDQEE